MRYKRAVKGTTGQAKKYHKWPWSSHMEFLDCTLQSRRSSSNVSQTTQDGEENTLQRAKAPPLSPNTEQNDVSSGNSPGSGQASSEMPPPLPRQQKRCKVSASSSDVDKVIRFLEKNKRKEERLDSVDLLFSSYAETFKKFSPRTRAFLKIELATLFARSEMAEMGAHSCQHRP